MSKIPKIGFGNDIHDLAVEAIHPGVLYISRVEWDRAEVGKPFRGSEVVKKYESQNFGYVVTKDGRYFRH